MKKDSKMEHKNALRITLLIGAAMMAAACGDKSPSSASVPGSGGKESVVTSRYKHEQVTDKSKYPILNLKESYTEDEVKTVRNSFNKVFWSIYKGTDEELAMRLIPGFNNLQDAFAKTDKIKENKAMLDAFRQSAGQQAPLIAAVCEGYILPYQSELSGFQFRTSGNCYGTLDYMKVQVEGVPGFSTADSSLAGDSDYKKLAEIFTFKPKDETTARAIEGVLSKHRTLQDSRDGNVSRLAIIFYGKAVKASEGLYPTVTIVPDHADFGYADGKGGFDHWWSWEADQFKKFDAMAGKKWIYLEASPEVSQMLGYAK
jgi:hypothetical protein